MPPTPSTLEILHAYRHLYRHGLRAIHYSTPARYTLRDRLRLSFRSSSTSSFEPHRIQNTLEFLSNAAKSTGMEHKILRNLLLVWYWERDHWAKRRRMGGWNFGDGMIREWRGVDERVIMERSMDGFYWTLRMLNESMGLCLR